MQQESITKFSFKIEAKPEGGFVARSEGLGETFEGATKEEVEEKIRAKVAEVAGPELAEALANALKGVDAPKIQVKKKIEFAVVKKTSSAASATANAQPSVLMGSSPDSGPIDRTSEGSGARFLKLLLIAGAVVLLIWLLLYRH